MKRNYTFIPLLLLLIVAIVACSNNSSKSAADNDSEGDATKATVQVPQFSADSAYQYIQTQADFGPRVPNTSRPQSLRRIPAKKLEEFGAKVLSAQFPLESLPGSEQSQNGVCPELPENLSFHVRTKNSLECFLKKMCCTVVFLCVTAGLLVNLKGYSLSCGKHSGFHTSDMTEFTTTKFDGTSTTNLPFAVSITPQSPSCPPMVA